MFHLVTGGSGSGKSAFAEAEICRLRKEETGGNGSLYYIATMVPYGAETRKKIERHRIMRAGRGFETLECYTGLKTLAEERILRNGADCVLLECMSNLAANEIYMEEGSRQNAVQEILEGIRKLNARCGQLVVVTNEVFSELPPASAEMQEYERILGGINVQMAQLADRVTEVVYGIPVEVKG